MWQNRCQLFQFFLQIWDSPSFQSKPDNEGKDIPQQMLQVNELIREYPLNLYEANTLLNAGRFRHKIVLLHTAEGWIFSIFLFC